jgi:osmotically-inducible protein OsmY
MTAGHPGIFCALILAASGFAVTTPMARAAGEPTRLQERAEASAGAQAAGSEEAAGHAETVEESDAAYDIGFDTEPRKGEAPDPEPGRAVLDARVEREIRELLESEPDVHVQGLLVEVQNGIVTLYGRVGSGAEKHLASSYSGSVRGAEGVVNLIEVVPGLEKGVEIVPPPRDEE